MFLAGSAMRVDTSYIKRKFYTACNSICLVRLLFLLDLHLLDL